MVEHAHGEYRFEAFELGRQLFQGERQVPGGQLRQVTFHRMELAEEQPVRVDTDHAVSTGAEHAPHVVTIAAADVEDALAGKVQMRRDPGPFPVRAPFGVHMHAEYLERPLAPRRQPISASRVAWRVASSQGPRGGNIRAARSASASAPVAYRRPGASAADRHDRWRVWRPVAVERRWPRQRVVCRPAPGEGVRSRFMAGRSAKRNSGIGTRARPWKSRPRAGVGDGFPGYRASSFSMALRFWAISSSL